MRWRASSWRPALTAHPERRPCAGVVARLAVRLGAGHPAGPTRRAAARGDCGRGARGVALVVREGSTLGPAVNVDRGRGELAREICVTFDDVKWKWERRHRKQSPASMQTTPESLATQRNVPRFYIPPSNPLFLLMATLRPTCNTCNRNLQRVNSARSPAVRLSGAVRVFRAGDRVSTVFRRPCFVRTQTGAIASVFHNRPQ